MVTVGSLRSLLRSPAIEQQLKATGVAQVIVVLKPAASTAAGGVALSRSFRTSQLSQLSALAAAVRQRPGRRGARQRGGKPKAVRVFGNLGVMYGTADEQGLAALGAHPGVASISGAPAFSLIRPSVLGGAKLKDEVTWGIAALGVKALWDQGLTGKGVRIGHLDTGVDGSHPALRGAIAAFAELDAFGGLVAPAPAPYDSDEHGTHTAATVAGRPVRGKAVGIAPGSQLASALVIEGGDSVARVLGGLDWALDQGIRVLSMSLGFRGWWEDFLPIMQILRSRGVLPVIAVGNEGPGTSRSPGNYSESLSVGAVDQELGVAEFSSSQRFQRAQDPVVPDLVGPGVDIVSAKPGRGYQRMNGTSMAAPHIAGLAALLFEARPAATVDEVESALLRSCGGAGSADRGGRGFPSAERALAILTGVKARVKGPRRRSA